MLRKTVKEIGFHSFIYFLGNAAGAVASILLLPVYTRFLSKTDYGILEILDSMRFLIIQLLIAGFIPAMAKFYKEADSDDLQREVVGTSFWIILGSAFVWGAGLFLFNTSLAQTFLGSSDLVSYINLGIILLCLQPILTANQHYLNIRKQSTFYVTISLARMVVNVGANLLFIVVFLLQAKGMLYGEFVSSGIFILILTAYLIRQNGLPFRAELIKRMAKFGLPMIPNMLSAVLMQRADRYLIQKFNSLSDVGLYGLGYKFPFMLNYLILNAFTRIWNSATMYEIAQQKDYQRTYAKVTTYVMTVYVLCQYALIILAPTVLKILAAPEYFPAWKIVQIVGLGHCIYALHNFFTIGAFIKNKTWYLPISYLISAFISITFNWYFLPRYGYIAAAWNVVVTYTVFSGLNFVIFQKIYPIPYEFRRLGSLFGIGIVLVLLNNALYSQYFIIEFMKELFFAAILPGILLVGSYFDREEKQSLREELQKIHPTLARVYSKIASIA